MAFYQRAFLYLWRKRGKSLILLLILLFVNTMILSTNMILCAAEDTKADMQEKTKSKVVCEAADAGARITAQELEKIQSLPHVASINRLGENRAFLSNAAPMTGSASEDDANWMVRLSSYDELAYDSPFADRPYKLTQGDFLTAGAKNSAVVHADFAEKNGLAVGDEIGVEIKGGKSVNLKIIGLYRAGTERKQEDGTMAVHRIENQIFIDNTAYIDLFGENDFYKAAVYTKAPEDMERLSGALQTLLGSEVSVEGSDALYRQMKAPLEQITRVVELMLLLTFAAGTVVIALLLCMWTRTRQKEMAVFISVGEGKIRILLQVILESAALFLMAVTASCGLGAYTAKWLQKLLASSGTAELGLEISLRTQDIIFLLAIGGTVILISVFLSVLPILRTSPREALSRMEG